MAGPRQQTTGPPSRCGPCRERDGAGRVRAAALLRLALAPFDDRVPALGAFYRRLSARIGKAKAVTATARKIRGFALQRRASRNRNMSTRVRPLRHPGTVSGWSKICIGAPEHFGFVLQPIEAASGGGAAVSFGIWPRWSARSAA